MVAIVFVLAAICVLLAPLIAVAPRFWWELAFKPAGLTAWKRLVLFVLGAIPAPAIAILLGYVSWPDAAGDPMRAYALWVAIAIIVIFWIGASAWLTYRWFADAMAPSHPEPWRWLARHNFPTSDRQLVRPSSARDDEKSDGP